MSSSRACRPPCGASSDDAEALAVRDTAGVAKRNLLRIAADTPDDAHRRAAAGAAAAAVPLRAGRRHHGPGGQLRRLRRPRHLRRSRPDRRA